MSEKKESKYILAIDHGTSGLKTTIMSVHGQCIDFAFEPTPIHFLPDGGAEQDPDDWWRATLLTCKRLVQKNVVPAQQIVAICVSSTFSSTVAVDRDGNPLMNSLTWMDSRGAPHVKRLVGGILEIEGYGLSNIVRWLPRTGGAPTLSGKDDIAHVLFIKHEIPEIYEKTYMFLGSKDYLNLKLTGEFASSPDSMMLFWVVNTRDVRNLHYDERLMDRVGIEKSKLPPLKAATDVLGPVSKEFADEIGISRDVRVIVGSPDHQCAGIGAGAVQDYQGYIYIGTSSWLQCVVPFKKTDIFHQIASFPHAIPGKYFTADEQDMAGGCLAFLKDNLLFHDNPLQGKGPPDDIYQKFDEIVSNVPAGSGKVIFTPWLHGERTPVDSNTLRGGFYNLSLTSNVEHLIRATFEGVAYNTRWMLKYVEKFIKRRMDPLNIVGGGAKSGPWCQILADVLDRDIRQVRDPIQANARGAAFIASVGLGYVTFDEIPGLIEYSNTYQPNPRNRELYDELFGEFLSIYRNNRKMFHRLNR
jgi:xylulokinase